MTDIERLKTTKDYLREQYQEDIKKCKYPELKDVIKQTYEENKKGFSTAIKAIEENNKLKAEIERLKVFKSYFDSLYGTGLKIANWHQNGDLEPFDNFYDSAIEEMAGDAE